MPWPVIKQRHWHLKGTPDIVWTVSQNLAGAPTEGCKLCPSNSMPLRFTSVQKLTSNEPIETQNFENKKFTLIFFFKKKKNLLASKRRTNCSTFLDIVATATSRVKTSKRVNLNVTESNRVTDWDSLFLKSEDKIGKLQTKKKMFLCVTSVYSQFLRMELLVVLLNPENLLREKKNTLFLLKIDWFQETKLERKRMKLNYHNGSGFIIMTSNISNPFS